jgi:hypothetical protein
MNLDLATGLVEPYDGSVDGDGDDWGEEALTRYENLKVARLCRRRRIQHKGAEGKDEHSGKEGQ